MVRDSFIWNLEQSGKIMNREVVSRNCILHLMNDELRFDRLKRHHIIPYGCHDDILVAIVREP